MISAKQVKTKSCVCLEFRRLLVHWMPWLSKASSDLPIRTPSLFIKYKLAFHACTVVSMPDL